MVTVLRRIIFFGSVALSMLGVIAILMQTDSGQSPAELRIAMLSLIFFLGVMLIIVIAKNGLGD